MTKIIHSTNPPPSRALSPPIARVLLCVSGSTSPLLRDVFVSFQLTSLHKLVTSLLVLWRLQLQQPHELSASLSPSSEGYFRIP